jgi:(2Fe-2S) ferredoxin
MDAEKPPFRPYQKHILICTGPRCAPDASPALYQLLKDLLKELQLHDGPARIQRSQCHCFGVCQGGPIVVVYPDGIWYHHVTPEKLERILQEHLRGNRPVSEYILYRKNQGEGNK